MKNLTLALALLIISITGFSQTLLVGGPTGNGDFEAGTSGWTFVNGTQPNQWVVGSQAAPGFSGNNAVYISSDGSSHSYNTSASTYSYFYKDIAVPAGTNTLWVVFDYICNGEAVSSNFGVEARDAFRIWARSTSEVITPGNELSNVFISAGAGFYNQPSWKRKKVAYLPAATYAGGTVRLIFQWFNDNTNGTQPPAAIDNIEVYSSCQEFIAPSADNSSMTGTSATLVWTTVGNATGYLLRYKKLSDPNSVSTYTNPVTITGGNIYYYTLNGLTPGTDYIAEVSPIGLSCTEYSSPASFRTLDAPVNDDCSGAITLPVWTSTQPGTLATFRGATPSGVSGSCPNSANNDVWFRFVATSEEQLIMTNDPDFGENTYSAKDITLFTGDCNNLQPVAIPCAGDTMSVYQGTTITRIRATGLTPGTTYYVRVNTNNNTGYDDFAISIYGQTTPPSCPQLLRPVFDTVLNYGTPFTFQWRKAAGADAYRLRIFDENGGLTLVYTRDTSYVFTPAAGQNYTWIAQPYNAAAQTTGCTAATFSTCPAIANPVTLTAPNGTSKCANDSVLIKASNGTNIQWFRNNVAITGATADSLWVVQAGSYSVRIFDGSCYSDASNIITVTSLATPAKPQLTASGSTTFCDGSSVTLTSSIDQNNQWFNGSNPISGSNDISYTATTSGMYYVRVENSVTACPNYSDTIQVVASSSPVAPVIFSGGTSICAGDSVRLSSSSTSNNQWYKDGVLISGAIDSFYYAKTAATYSVKISNGSCQSGFSNSIVLTSTAPPAAPVVTPTGGPAFCEGDSVKLTASTGAQTSWYQGTTLLSVSGSIYYAKTAGNYTARVSQGGCTSAASNSVALTTNPLPVKPVVTATGYILSAAAGYSSYQWYLNNTIIAGSTASQVTVLQAGNYKVEVTDNKGCKNISDNFNAVVTGLNDVEVLGYKISIFPNPVQDVVNIAVKPGNSITKKFSITLTDMYGRTLAVSELKDGLNRISLSQYSQGHYFITIRSGNTVKSIKVLKGQ